MLEGPREEAMPAIVLVVELETVAGKKDAFVARVLEHRNNVLSNEPGCLRFDVVASAEDAGKVFLYEVYADDAALETHANTSYMKRYLEDTKPMIARRHRNRCRMLHD